MAEPIIKVREYAWNLERMLKCFFMSVPSTCSMTAARSIRWSDRDTPCTQQHIRVNKTYIALHALSQKTFQQNAF